MSANNLFETRRKGFVIRTITITNKATYTVRIGRSTDNFIVDRVVNIVTTADGNDLTITIPDGLFPGQRLLIVWDTLGDNETVTITSTGSSPTFTGEDAYASLEWVNSTAGWVSLAAATT